MLAVGGAVLGSLQFGYNTGVINAPQKVSAVPPLASQHQQALLCTLATPHPHARSPCLLDVGDITSEYSDPERVTDS